jgi:hypothetical protein
MLREAFAIWTKLAIKRCHHRRQDAAYSVGMWLIRHRSLAPIAIAGFRSQGTGYSN